MAIKKATALSSRLLVCVSILFVLLQPLSQVASAAPIDIRAKGDSQKVQSYALYFAAAHCAAEMKKHISESNSGSVSDAWFDDNKTVSVGHLVSKSNGRHSCVTVLNKAIPMWGYSDTKEFLRAVGYRDTPCTGNDGCAQGSTPFRIANNTNMNEVMRNAIKNQAYKSTSPTMSDAMTYTMYLESLSAACDISFVSRAGSGPQVDTSGKPLQNLHTIKSMVSGTSGEKEVVDAYYRMGAQSGKKVTLYERSGGGAVQSTCGEMISALGQDKYADAYLANYKKLTPEEQELEDTATAGTSGAEADDKAESTCKVDNIGWIICPVFTFLSDITDAAYAIVADMLSVNTNDYATDGTLFNAWRVMASIANVFFVVVFLFIIYSQISGIGISNYGIKRMLPRLIVGAILINTSYWVCILAIEASNLLGYSLKSVFDGLGATIATTSADDATGILDGGNTALNWLGLTSAVLILGGAALYAGMAVLLPLLLAAIVTIVIVFVALTIRQALIIILVVAAPLALAAWLLPNTETYFKKWLKLFGALLLMFPVVAIVFAISSLASTIIMGASSSTPIKIMGAAVSIVPLIVIPAIMKGAGTALGVIMNRVPGSNGLGNGMRERAGKLGKRLDNQIATRALRSDSTRGKVLARLSGARGRARRGAIDNAAEQNRKLAEANYISDEVQREGSLMRQMSRGGGEAARNTALANAINTEVSLSAENIKANKAVIEHFNLSEAEKAILQSGGTVAKEGRTFDGSNRSLRFAAQQSIAERGDAEAINQMLDHASTLNAGNAAGAEELNNIANALQSSSGRPKYVQAATLQNMRQQGIGGTDIGDSTRIMHQAVNDGVYSAGAMASTGRQELGLVLNAAQTATRSEISDESIAKLATAAKTALEDARIAPTVGKQAGVIGQIRDLPQRQHPGQGTLF